MNLEEFVELVRQMRYNQRRYFTTRKQEALELSKKLEKQVDDAILNYSQKKLF